MYGVFSLWVRLSLKWIVIHVNMMLCCSQSLAVEVMDFNLLTDSEARSPALSLSDSGTPQHDPGCKGQDNSGQFIHHTTYKRLCVILKSAVLNLALTTMLRSKGTYAMSIYVLWIINIIFYSNLKAFYFSLVFPVSPLLW